MYSLNLHLIIFIIIALVSTISIAKDNRSEVPNLQNPPIAQIKQNSTTALMVRKNSDNWDDFVKVGTIATTSQICEVFSHPFFKSPLKGHELLDTMNGHFGCPLLFHMQLQELNFQQKNSMLLFHKSSYFKN